MKKPSCSSGTSQPRQWRHWSVSSRAKPPSLSPKSHMFAARTPQPLWVLQADYHRRTSGELHSPPEEFEHQFVRFIIPFPRGNGALKGHFENLWNHQHHHLIGGIPSPLKNMSQLGWLIIPNCFWTVTKFHGSSHHQPDQPDQPVTIFMMANLLYSLQALSPGMT